MADLGRADLLLPSFKGTIIFQLNSISTDVRQINILFPDTNKLFVVTDYLKQIWDVASFYLLQVSNKVRDLNIYRTRAIISCSWLEATLEYYLEIVGEWVMKRQPSWIKIFHISPILLGRFGDKKSETCSLCCVACGGYMERKTCNVFFHCRHCSVQCFDSPSN